MIHTNKIIFPRAFAFAIDDLGWNEGSNLLNHTPSGPYRVGVKRNFTVADYKFIVDVGKAVGVRIQSLFILSEMDRENVLADYPTTTYLRERWNNKQRINDEQLNIMRYVCQEASHMEFGLHGTGHEYWADDGIQRRAEWYNMADRRPWPEEDLRGHIEAFKKIMAQYDLTAEKGHSFPESFVPCAYSYYWNPGGEYSLGKLISEAGVKYANTDFAQIPELNPPQEINGGGFDHGVHVINRMNYGNLWYELSMLPKVTVDLQGTDIVESHWSNWLAQDEFMQDDVTARWINYYRHVQRYDSRYVAKNTEQLHSQWLYKKYTIVNETTPGTVAIDNRQMPHESYARDILGNMVLKVKCSNNEHVTRATINGVPIPCIFKDEAFAFLYLPPLAKDQYILSYEVGPGEMKEYVFNDGTYNIYSVEVHDTSLVLKLKMYGKQWIKIKSRKPSSVISLTKGLRVTGEKYDDAIGMIHLQLAADDFQGKRGVIRIER